MKVDTVVVGAGLGGLVTALHALESGERVHVVSLTLGGRVGRVWLGDAYVETGAEFVDTNHHTLQSLAHHLGVALRARTSAWMTLGRRSTPEVRRELQTFWQHLQDLAQEIPDPYRPWKIPPSLHHLKGKDLQGYARAWGLSPEAQKLLRLYALNLEAAEPEDVSLIGVLFQERLYQEKPGENARYKVVGGMASLVDALVDRILHRGGSLSLGVRVHRVVLTPREVQVHTGTGPIRAERVVLALPLPDLKGIQGLPPELYTVSYPYGSVLKIFLRFREAFWRETRPQGTLPDPFVSAVWEETDVQSLDGGGVLALWVSGKFASTWPEDTPSRIQRAVELINHLFPGSHRLFTAGYVAAWSHAYPHVPPGGEAFLKRLWTFHHPRIRLVGDHMSPFVGYVEGAVESAGWQVHPTHLHAEQGGTP